MVEQSGSSNRRARAPRGEPGSSGEGDGPAPSAKRTRAKRSDDAAEGDASTAGAAAAATAPAKPRASRTKVKPAEAEAPPAPVKPRAARAKVKPAQAEAPPPPAAPSPTPKEPSKSSSTVAQKSPAATRKAKGWSPFSAYARAGEKLLTRMRKEKLVTAADVIREIEKSPQGPQVIAAFDFDGTLLGGYSGVMLMMERLKRKEVKRSEITDTLNSTIKTLTKQMEDHEVITRGFTHWAGKTEEEMEELAGYLFENKIQDMIFPEMRQVIAAHRKAGHTIVVATAATRYQVERVVKELGVDNLLCTELEVAGGKLTGKLVGESLFGPGKVAALKRFIEQHGCDFADTHFYGDGDEEIGLMEAVGHPHPVNPSKKLAEAAKTKGWPVLRLESRAKAKPANVLRGMAGLMAIMQIAPAGLAVGLMTRDKRQASNLILPTWIQAQFDLCGVKIRVSGRRNLHVRRPAIFIFNHRNNWDGMIAALLVRTDVAGIGKKEIGNNPIGKLGTSIVPTILVDRGGGDPAKAAEALRPAVEAIEKGYSIILAPEGTRVRGHHGSVGPFKKGAFHIAMAAGVPIVPIVIRNALDIAQRDGAMRPGTVEVAVLPPIPVDGWTKDNLAEKIEEVRRKFTETLNDWPEPDEEEKG